MTEVYLIRHAESEFNANNDHLIGGRSNYSPLTERGIEQAKALGRYFLQEEIFPTHVHVSPAVRTMQTAEYSLHEMRDRVKNLEWQIHDAIQEMSQGEFEGANRKETYTDEVIAEINRLGKDFKLRGGESMNETGLRMWSWLDETIVPSESPERHFVYTHGMAKRCLIGHMLGWSLEDIRANTTPNVCVTSLVSVDNSWHLADYAKCVI